MKNDNENMKFLVIVKKPTERMISFYSMAEANSNSARFEKAVTNEDGSLNEKYLKYVFET